MVPVVLVLVTIYFGVGVGDDGVGADGVIKIRMYTPGFRLMSMNALLLTVY